MANKILSAEEFRQLREALNNPEYVKSLIEDIKREKMVEVDNPFRTELRPRRGTENG